MRRRMGLGMIMRSLTGSFSWGFGEAAFVDSEEGTNYIG